MNISELRTWLNRMESAGAIAADEPLYIVQADIFLYPQTDAHKRLYDFQHEDAVKKWLTKEAINHLASEHGVWEVRRHWVHIVTNAMREEELRNGTA